MCRPLTVSCLRYAGGIEISEHFLTLSDLKISCEHPGSLECRSGQARLVDFQNPPTECAGYVRGLRPETDECEERCLDSLERYGQALYRMNAKGPRTTPRGCKWLRRLRVSYQDTATDCPITRGFEDGEEALSVDCKG